MEEQTKEAVAVINMKVDSVTPAVINSNIKELKEKMIPIIKQKENVVVTKENYQEIKTWLSTLNKESKAVNDYKKTAKQEANKELVIFEADCMEIVNTYKDVVNKLKEQIAVFEEEEKAERKSKIQEEIDQVINYAIEKGYISDRYKNKFMFDEKWMLKSSSQKSIKEGINEELNRLASEYKQELQNVEAIKDTITRQCDIENIEHLSADKYVKMLENDTPIAPILTEISRDVDAISQSVKKQAEQKVQEAKETIREEVKQEVQEEIKQAPIQEEAVNDNETTQNIIDDKTGEVIARDSKQGIVVKAPDVPTNIKEGATYKYTYTFEGDIQSILYLNRFLKVLANIFKTFKYEREGK